MSVLRAIRLSKAPATAFAVVGMFWGSFAAQVPVLKAQIAANDAVFGIALLGTAVGLMATMILAPVFDARFRERAMPLACVALALAFLVPGFATHPLFFACAMFVAGMASGLCDVTMNARVSELEAASGRSLMNANHGVFSLAYAGAAVLTGVAREADIGPVLVFAAFGVLALCIARFTWVEVPPVDSEDAQKQGFPVAIVAICGLVVMIAFMAEAAVENWSALHVERTLGGSAAEGALGPAMLGLTMAIGRFGGQAVCERLSDLAVITGAAALAVTGAVLAALAPAPGWAYLGFATLGLGISVIGPLGLAIVGRLVPASVRTTAISRTAVIGFTAFFVAPALMGLVSEAFGLRMAFLSVALMLVVTFPVVGALRKLGA